ncbi:MAG TPA: cation diffusion facilitator family transporter [Cyclobacteriaceae bacterium]|jgi:cobalt-zinc-cadmium efflux system protein|nr:cation diffusion facilitator family transporter [Cyclobacteriaceae bacterium]
MSHSHHHENHHHHHHDSVNRAFLLGIALNIVFVIIESGFGLWVGSLSLLTDAGHNLGDVAGLVLIVLAIRLSKKKPNEKYTYGYGKTTILVALANAVTLLIAVGAIGWEAIGRLKNPLPVQGQTIAWVAFAGIIINGATALLFMKDQHKDLNAKGAFLHMVADALVSLGVLVSGIIISYTQWFWLDAVISIVIMVVIVVSSWSLLKDSLRLTLDGVPSDINLEGIRKYLLGIKGVTGIHDLHIWAMSTNATALTVHLVIPGEMEKSQLATINNHLHNQFNIDHTTIQVERTPEMECEQRC